MSKPSRTAQRLKELLCRTHNPLLMARGCNPIPHEIKERGGRENLVLPYYETFQKLYQKAITVTKPENVVFGLEVDYSKENQGLGGFYSGGFVPINLFADLPQDSEKTFRWRWPRNPHSREGKYMRYIASINLGVWPRVLHDATSWPAEWLKTGKSAACGIDITKEYYRIFEQDVWMHIFSSGSEMENAVSDCQIFFTNEFNYSRMEPRSAEITKGIYGNKIWTEEQIREKIVEFQEKNTDKPECLSTPDEYFTNIVPRFYYDGIGPRDEKLDDIFEAAEDDKDHLMHHGEGKCSVYGVPQSQQTPKRFISPDSYNGVRALTPLFAFSDAEHDMSHQFYGDALMSNDLRPSQAYCKLDSSCT